MRLMQGQFVRVVGIFGFLHGWVNILSRRRGAHTPVAEPVALGIVMLHDNSGCFRTDPVAVGLVRIHAALNSM